MMNVLPTILHYAFLIIWSIVMAKIGCTYRQWEFYVLLLCVVGIGVCGRLMGGS